MYKTLKEVSTLIDDGDWIESKDQSEKGIWLIQTGNVGINELKYKEDITCNQIYNDLKNRDQKDIEDGNFIKPVSAIEIDTTNLNLDEALKRMLSYIKE